MSLIIQRALDRGVRPEEALGMGQAETNMGTHNTENPLHLNIKKMLEEMHEGRMQHVQGAVDDTDAALLHLQNLKKNFGEVKGLQSYQGWGILKNQEGGSDNWYGQGKGRIDTRKEIPYVKRVKAFQRVFEDDPKVQALIEAVREARRPYEPKAEDIW
jgi:hypothetical protein